MEIPNVPISVKNCEEFTLKFKINVTLPQSLCFVIIVPLILVISRILRCGRLYVVKGGLRLKQFQPLSLPWCGV